MRLFSYMKHSNLNEFLEHTERNNWGHAENNKLEYDISTYQYVFIFLFNFKHLIYFIEAVCILQDFFLKYMHTAIKIAYNLEQFQVCFWVPNIFGAVQCLPHARLPWPLRREHKKRQVTFTSKTWRKFMPTLEAWKVHSLRDAPFQEEENSSYTP